MSRWRALVSLWASCTLAFGSLAAADLQVAIRPTVSGSPLLLDSLRYQNAAGETFSVTRLSYLLSGFALEQDDGVWIEATNQYAWLDVTQRRMDFRLERLPEGKFRALRFDVGLDSIANASDPAQHPAHDPLNPNLNGLHWNWQGGYVFLALEGFYRSAGGILQGYAYHLARDSNRTRVNINAPLVLPRDAAVLLDLDLAAVFNAPRPLSLEKDGNATHSRDGDPVATALVANLRGSFHLDQILSITPDAAAPPSTKPLYLPENYTPYRFTINRSFTIPDLPRDNPLLEERVALGNKLFHDPTLSRDGTVSCASCHQESFGLSDPRRFSVGIRGQTGSRRAMPLANLAWKTSFFWDGRAPSLRAQALMPIQDHSEMDESLDRLTDKLSAHDPYPRLFRAAFGSTEITPEKIGLALENYLLTLTTREAKFDRALRGQIQFSPEEQKGFELFMTEYDPRTKQFGADCFHCHGGPLFTDHQFHNNGLAPSEADPGRLRVTGAESDRGKFATPSLRNVARRPPYMHDGRFASLDDVIDHYNSGIHPSRTLDPNLAKHPTAGLQLSADDRRALVAFLRTLSDEPQP
jgi:cytochrome c peroxidase